MQRTALFLIGVALPFLKKKPTKKVEEKEEGLRDRVSKVPAVFDKFVSEKRSQSFLSSKRKICKPAGKFCE